MNKKVFAAIAVAILVIICAISAITLAHCAYTEASSDASTESAESSGADESTVSELSEAYEEEESLADPSEPSESSAEDVSKVPEETTPAETSKVEAPYQPDEPSEPEDVSIIVPDEEISELEESDRFDESTEPVGYCVITGRMSRVTYTTGDIYGTVSVKDGRYVVKNTKDGFELIVPIGEIITLVFAPVDDYGVFSIFVNETRMFVDSLNEYTLTCNSESIQVRVMLKEVGEKAEQFAGPIKIVLNGETHFVASYDEAKKLLSLNDLEVAGPGYEIVIYKNGVVVAFTSIGNGIFDASWGGTMTAQRIYSTYIGSWCSYCGKRTGHGTNGTCVKYLRDLTCSTCGEYCQLLECHTCDE